MSAGCWIGFGLHAEASAKPGLPDAPAKADLDRTESRSTCSSGSTSNTWPTGITSVIERGASLEGFEAYETLRRADRLRVRATVTIRIPRADDPAAVERFISGLPFDPVAATSG